MAITVPNVVKVTGSGVTSVTTSGVTTVAGSTFTISSTADFGVTINTPSDSKSNAYGALGTSQADDSNAFRMSVFYKENGAGGAGHTATVTYSSATYPTAFFSEVRGAAVASYDSGSLAAAADNNGSPHDVTSGTFAQANNAVLTWIGTDGGGTRSYSCSGFTVTEETDGNNYWTGATGYKLVTATTAQLASWVESATRGLMKIVAFKEAAGGGGDVSAALTGSSGTGSLGTVAPSTAKGLSGNAGTGAVGSVAAARSKALTGTGGTGSAGAVGPASAKGLTGNAGTSSAGTVRASLTVGLTGVSAAGSVGTVSASTGADVTVALTGVQAVGNLGTLTLSTVKGITGNAGSSSVGAVAPSAARALTGNASTGAAGTVAPSNSIALTGDAANGAVGTVSPPGNVTVALSGVQATAQVGALAPANLKALAGTTLFGSVGSVVQGREVGLAGTGATAAVGSLVAVVTGNVSVALTGVQAMGGAGLVLASGGSPPVLGSLIGRTRQAFGIRESRQTSTRTNRQTSRR